MQQTQTYKLNKPELDDDFAIAPLNENMDKLEAAILAEAAAEAQARAASDAALDARVTQLELHKFVIGTYIGNGGTYKNPQFVNFGFTPGAVLVQEASKLMFVIPDYPGASSSPVRCVEGGISVYAELSNSWNTENTTYRYIAFV